MKSVHHRTIEIN